jgi:gamma-glutamylcyclotransferase (GGCT)/AIG2-like uncharacterized protein YtfP
VTKVYFDAQFNIYDVETGEIIIPTTTGWTESDVLKTIKERELELTFNPELGSLWFMSAALATGAQDREHAYANPFPIAVFGTLRKNCGNHRLMARYKIAKATMGFLSHFTATGLSVNATENGSAPVELYHYVPNVWKEMIEPVDGLEGFSPKWGRGYGYHRTLVKVNVLPEDYEHELFANWRSGMPPSLRERRSLGIPPEKWAEYPTTLAWVYSNIDANDRAKKFANSPIVWE